MSVDFKELLNKLKSGEIATKSKLDLRNENKQDFGGNGKYPWLKKPKNKLCKILLLTEIAIPFNPFTCEVEENGYNDDVKFRPSLSCSDAILTLKTYYNENEEIKSKFLRMAKFKEAWDTSNPNELNEKDLEVFRPFRVAKIYSPRVMNVKMPTVTGNKFGKAYLFPIERDGFGDLIIKDYDKSDKEEKAKFNQQNACLELLNIHRAYRAIYQEEYARWKDTHKEVQEKEDTEMRRNIMSKIPVSSDVPFNIALGIEYEMDNKTMQAKNSLDADEILPHIVMMRKNTKIDSVLDDYRGRFIGEDINSDYFEVDVVVGNEEDDAQRGNNTKYNTPKYNINRCEGYTEFSEKLSKYLQDQDLIEETVKASAVKSEVDESLLKRVYTALSTEIPFSSIQEFLTNEIVENFQEVLSNIYGDSFDEVMLDLDAGEKNESLTTEDVKVLSNMDIEAMANSDMEEIEI